MKFLQSFVLAALIFSAFPAFFASAETEISFESEGQNSLPESASVPADFSAPKNASGTKLFGRGFGLVPGKNDATQALISALENLKNGGILELEKGEYHFFENSAAELAISASNHEFRAKRKIHIPIVGAKNLKIRGNGATFVFHGETLGILLLDSENVEIRNLKIDYAGPIFPEAKIVNFASGTTIVEINENEYPCEIRDGKLVFKNGARERKISVVTMFKKGSKQIVERSSDVVFYGNAKKISAGKYALEKDFSKIGAGAKIGDMLVLRSYERPNPAILLYRAKNSKFVDVAIFSSFGMGFLAQRSENVIFKGSGTAKDKTSGTFPNEKRGKIHSTSADATHFSNVAGTIIVENSFFETMLDDAINVHSTALKIIGVPAKNQILCRFEHDQSFGFDVFLAGEKLRFIKAKTLENRSEIEVQRVEEISAREILITLCGDVPEEIELGDAVENADFQPEVIFRGNIVQNNRARGALFTTSKRVLVEDNIFRNVAGSAILLAGDAAGWFESGGCKRVEIRKNLFKNNLTSRFQFTNAVISIFPEVRNLAAQSAFYHENIFIEDNIFETFDVPLVFAISTKNLVFKDNKIRFTKYLRGNGEKLFQFKKCAEISISGNEFFPKKTLRLGNDFSLEMTSEAEISLK